MRAPLPIAFPSRSSTTPSPSACWYEVRAYPSPDGGLGSVTSPRVYPAGRAGAAIGAIVESSDDGIIGKTLDGVIVTWNEGAHLMYGYTAEEGWAALQLGPPSCRREMEEVLERLREGERVGAPRNRAHAQGRQRVPRLAHGLAGALDDQGRVRGASTIARDITERKRSWKRCARSSRAWALRAAWRTTSTTCSPASWGTPSRARDMGPPDHGRARIPDQRDRRQPAGRRPRT